MAANIPDGLRAVKPFLIIAKQLEKKELIVSYYVGMYAIQEGIKSVKDDDISKAYLFKAMDHLGQMKTQLVGDPRFEEAMHDELVAKAYVEEYALKLFAKADADDRAAQFSKSMSKCFYTASQIFMTLKQFGELSEEIEGMMKYAKWKAVEIDKCLKNGITPTPGPPGGFKEQNELKPPITHGDQPIDSISMNEPMNPPSTNPPSTAIGFELPPAPANDPFTQPLPPPEIKPVPRPRHPETPHGSEVGAGSEGASYKPTVQLGPDQAAKAQKFCKFASSAIEYDDIEGAIEFLTKAMKLLKTGKED